jgi:hypothetical protein
LTVRRALPLALVAAVAFRSGREEVMAVGGARYEELVTLYEEWREFQKPRARDHVPDFTAGAMAEQKRRLPELQQRLAAIDASHWPVSQQIDHRLVAAEMNGLEFDHRVLRPWSRNPCFYTVVHDSEPDVPLREGPSLPGTIELWRLRFPLAAPAAAELQAQLRAVPGILAQAKGNLVEDARDLWRLGARVKRRESGTLARLAGELAAHHPDLVPDVERARQAVEAFRSWLEGKSDTMTGRSGVGIENYDWYLRHVHLVPYGWRDEVALMQRELGRALAQLKLEEARNRGVPPLEPAADAAEHERRSHAAVSDYLRFLDEKDIFTVTEDMDAALRARIGSFAARDARDFFSQVDLREPLLLRCHGTHWFDLARLRRDPHPSPIRRVPLLYNMWDGRAEGLATGMEELMLGAGLYEGRPRSRELVYVMVAMRAARALAALRVHSGELDVAEAVRFAHEWTLRGWLKVDGETVWGEQQLYLEQPGYGTCYLTGKAQIEMLIAERARQQGDAFSSRRFFDEFNASGMIPVSMIRWELTGLPDERPGPPSRVPAEQGPVGL